jgi:hypothetical protein
MRLNSGEARTAISSPIGSQLPMPGLYQPLACNPGYLTDKYIKRGDEEKPNGVKYLKS